MLATWLGVITFTELNTCLSDFQISIKYAIRERILLKCNDMLNLNLANLPFKLK